MYVWIFPIQAHAMIHSAHWLGCLMQFNLLATLLCQWAWKGNRRASWRSGYLFRGWFSELWQGPGVSFPAKTGSIGSRTEILTSILGLFIGEYSLSISGTGTFVVCWLSQGRCIFVARSYRSGQLIRQAKKRTMLLYDLPYPMLQCQHHHHHSGTRIDIRVIHWINLFIYFRKSLHQLCLKFRPSNKYLHWSDPIASSSEMTIHSV